MRYFWESLWRLSLRVVGITPCLMKTVAIDDILSSLRNNSPQKQLTFSCVLFNVSLAVWWAVGHFLVICWFLASDF